MTASRETEENLSKFAAKSVEKKAHARGNITAQPDDPTRQSRGTKGVAKIIIPAMIAVESKKGNQNL